jgi:23S rRNA (guanosine2251-2'-O)-methyltransferase
VKENTFPRKRRHELVQEDDCTFILDSPSALSEFKKHKPESIIEVIEKPFKARVTIKAVDFKLLLKECAERSHDILIALDHITDPRNFGAIVRSAAFFGIKNIVIPTDRQAPITNAAVNTSMGGFALTDISTVTNLTRALEDLKKAGYWIIGTDAKGEEVADVKGFYDKIVLVLGSEDKGISHNVRKNCDRMIRITGTENGIESLNVSVAAGILIHELIG